MISKQSQILAYIRDLKPGTVFSVRSLASELGISEGTAYKATKSAEAEGLVITKNKVGTIRVGKESQEITLLLLTSRLSLQVLTGEELLRQELRQILPAIGSAEQLEAKLQKLQGNTLCICGDREDIMLLALKYGAHLLVTDAAVPGDGVLQTAKDNKRSVLTTSMDGFSVLSSLTSLPLNTEDRYHTVRNWMSAPRYLYYNDYISDWNRMFYADPSGSLSYPVVDDEHRVVGFLPVETAFSSQPTTKISRVLPTETTACLVDETTPMAAALEKMLESKSGYAHVTRDGQLCGAITPMDVIRYCFINQSAGLRTKYSDNMESLTRDHNGGRVTYLLHLPEIVKEEEEASVLVLPCLLTAAKRHFELLGAGASRFDCGSFQYNSTAGMGGDVMISSEIKKKSESSCVITTEMYNDSVSFAEATFFLYNAHTTE